LLRWPQPGLSYKTRMIDDECGAVSGMRIGRENLLVYILKKPAPVPLCSPQIPRDLGSNPGLRGGKPTTNRLRYGTAIDIKILCSNYYDVTTFFCFVKVQFKLFRRPQYDVLELRIVDERCVSVILCLCG
jgi:hypothetical protein